MAGGPQEHRWAHQGLREWDGELALEQGSGHREVMTGGDLQLSCCPWVCSNFVQHTCVTYSEFIKLSCLGLPALCDADEPCGALQYSTMARG